MSYIIENKKFNDYLEKLSNEYDIYAPVRIKGGGRFSNTDSVRYKTIKKVEEIEYKEKSHFPAKEVLLPVTETLFNINDEELTEPTESYKKKLVFLRSCDIHAMERMDNMYLNNGPYQDIYYKRRREKTKYILMGCENSFENCFCASMNSNRTDDYSLGIKFLDEEVYLEVKDDEFKGFFGGEEIDFTPDFVTKNKHKVTTPDVKDFDLSIFEDKMWEDYTDRCIGCGRCNFSCPTCSCFTTTDIYYDENSKNGERRRVWAGCQVDQFTDMAGGHSFRKKQGQRMRFKTMHKIYDYKKRFDKNMCVGCGRCDDRCPEYISFATCINEVTHTLNKEEK